MKYTQTLWGAPVWSERTPKACETPTNHLFVHGYAKPTLTRSEFTHSRIWARHSGTKSGCHRSAHSQPVQSLHVVIIMFPYWLRPPIVRLLLSDSVADEQTHSVLCGCSFSAVLRHTEFPKTMCRHLCTKCVYFVCQHMPFRLAKAAATELPYVFSMRNMKFISETKSVRSTRLIEPRACCCGDLCETYTHTHTNNVLTIYG